MKAKFFNKYDTNFRWMGLQINKTTIGFGYYFGKPIWWFPYFEFIIAYKNYDHLGFKKNFSLCFGWLLFSFGIQIIGKKHE